MKKMHTLSFAIILFLQVFSAHAEQVEKAKLSTLNNFVNHFSTFKANFKQTVPDESVFDMNRSEGYVVIERPGKLFWVYQQPEYQEIVSDGVDLWIFDSDIDQATVRTLDSIQTDFPLRWLLYKESVTDNFEVIVGKKEKGVSWYNLVPKTATFFQSLEVAIKGGKLTQVWMYQGSSNVTKVIFEDIELDIKIPESQFLFIPPKGVDVIGLPSH